MSVQKGVNTMSQMVNVNFRLDEDDKKRMENVCAELGLSMSAAFTIFAKKVGRENRIPFDVSVDPFYSESNIRWNNTAIQITTASTASNVLNTTRICCSGVFSFQSIVVFCQRLAADVTRRDGWPSSPSSVRI